MTRKPRIAITVGDPAGIGPEIALKAAAESAHGDVVIPIMADCSDEAIIVVAGEPQSPAHVICTRPEEGVADPGVVDQRSAKAQLQVGVARHLADDLAEAIPAPWRARRR